MFKSGLFLLLLFDFVYFSEVFRQYRNVLVSRIRILYLKDSVPVKQKYLLEIAKFAWVTRYRERIH